MKRLIAVVVLMCLILTGCANRPKGVSITTPETTESGLTGDYAYNGVTTFNLNAIPALIELGDITFTIESIYVGETNTDIGYSDVIQLLVTFPSDMDKKDIYWILKDDIRIYLYINRAEDEQIASTRLDVILLDGGYPCDMEYDIYDNRLYLVWRAQRDGRYTVKDATMTMIIESAKENASGKFVIKFSIGSDLMCFFDSNGNTTDIGDKAIDFIDKRLKDVS